MNANERFELIGNLYYCDTGKLRPGKSDPFFDTNTPECREAFENWLATRLINCLMERCFKLEKDCDDMQKQLDDIG